MTQLKDNGAKEEIHSGRRYLARQPSKPEDFKTTTDVEEFVREATADFDQVTKDLARICCADSSDDFVKEFYGRTVRADDAIRLCGVLNHVGYRNPDFSDAECDMSMAFNLYKRVDDYSHEEGSHLWFLRTGEHFTCKLVVQYNRLITESMCAAIMGRPDDKSYGCSAMCYEIVVEIHKEESLPSRSKRQKTF